MIFGNQCCASYPDCLHVEAVRERAYDEPCATCGGLGVVITCIDDMCANSDRCIHGDGEEPCGDCPG